LITGADVVQIVEHDERVTLTTRDGKQFTSPVASRQTREQRRRAPSRHQQGWPPWAVALDMMEETPRALLRDVDPVLAGDAACAARSPAARYSRACDDEIGAEPRNSVRIQRYLFGDGRRIGQLIDGAHRETETVGLVADFVKGSRSYRSVRRRILSRSPYLLLSYVRDCLSSKPLHGEPGVTGI